MNTVRAAVWGTGRTGIEIVRAGVRRPWLRFAGAAVTSPVKEGRDLGEIAGLDAPLGVPATMDVEGLLRRDDIDLVFYAGLGDEAEIGRRLLQIVEAGKNAVTVSGMIHPPTALGAEGARRLAEACTAAGVRALGTGINPGFLLDVLPVAWLSGEASFTRLTARRVTDATRYGEGLLRDMGIGRPPGEVVLRPGSIAVDQSLRMVGDAAGIAFDEVRLSRTPIVSPLRRQSGETAVEPGTVTGYTHEASGIVDGEVRIAVQWSLVFMLDAVVDGLEEGVVIEIEGEPTMEMRLRSTLSADPYPATAARAISVVPGLLAMPPGLYTSAQVPLAVR